MEVAGIRLEGVYWMFKANINAMIYEALSLHVDMIAVL
jgi:hypothetical protein